MAVSVELQGLGKVKALFEGIKRRAIDDTPVMKKIGVIAEKDINNHFTQSKGPSGTWKPLKRPRKRGGSKPLLDTGNLRRSTSSDASRNVAEITNGAGYAGFHNSGTVRIPQRKFMWITPSVRTRMAIEYIKYLLRA